MDDETLDELEGLHSALTTSLASSGVLGKVKAQLRYAAIAAVRGADEEAIQVVCGRLPNVQDAAQRLTLALVYEYLLSTDSTFSAAIAGEELSITRLESKEWEGGRLRSMLNVPTPSAAPAAGARPVLVDLIAGLLNGTAGGTAGRPVGAKPAGEGATTSSSVTSFRDPQGDNVTAAPLVAHQDVAIPPRARVEAEPTSSVGVHDEDKEDEEDNPYDNEEEQGEHQEEAEEDDDVDKEAEKCRSAAEMILATRCPALDDGDSDGEEDEVVDDASVAEDDHRAAHWTTIASYHAGGEATDSATDHDGGHSPGGGSGTGAAAAVAATMSPSASSQASGHDDGSQRPSVGKENEPASYEVEDFDDEDGF